MRRSTYVQHSTGRDTPDADAEDDAGERKSTDHAWDWRDSQAPSSSSWCGVPRTNDKLANVTVDVYTKSEDPKENAVEMQHR